ncbi:transposable element Tcb2 transposase [Trichonephila clavipes]|nr:transposable element Tcb2 transposase [Trichonephila clavipes]
MIWDRGSLCEPYAQRQPKGDRVQSNSSTVRRVWKQWTNEHRTTRETGSGRWKMASVRENQHLLRKAMNDRTNTSRHLAACSSTDTGVLMSSSSIRRRVLHCRMRARVSLYRIPFTANHRQLRLQ